MENEAAKQADIAALRDKLFEGLTPLSDFAAALGLHPKTVKKKDPPIIYIGRDPYVPDDPGREWVLNGCRPVERSRAA